jgi:uncharacterized protein (DUF433 family)
MRVLMQIWQESMPAPIRENRSIQLFNEGETVNYQNFITIEPNKRGGKPCVRGLRIIVYEVLEYLASEMTEAEILDDFPDLTREDLKACIAYAADRERRFMSNPLSV